MSTNPTPELSPIDNLSLWIMGIPPLGYDNGALMADVERLIFMARELKTSLDTTTNPLPAAALAEIDRIKGSYRAQISRLTNERDGLRGQLAAAQQRIEALELQVLRDDECIERVRNVAYQAEAALAEKEKELAEAKAALAASKP